MVTGEQSAGSLVAGADRLLNELTRTTGGIVGELQVQLIEIFSR